MGYDLYIKLLISNSKTLNIDFEWKAATTKNSESNYTIVSSTIKILRVTVGTYKNDPTNHPYKYEYWIKGTDISSIARTYPQGWYLNTANYGGCLLRVVKNDSECTIWVQYIFENGTNVTDNVYMDVQYI